MMKYVQVFILLSVVGNVFAIPMFIGLSTLLGTSISAGRWPGLLGVYVFFFYVFIIGFSALVLWISRKAIPDGETQSGRNAYRRTGIAIFLLFGLAAFFPQGDSEEINLEIATNLSIAIGMPLGALVLERISPKIRAWAGVRKRATKTELS